MIAVFVVIREEILLFCLTTNTISVHICQIVSLVRGRLLLEITWLPMRLMMSSEDDLKATYVLP